MGLLGYLVMGLFRYWVIWLFRYWVIGLFGCAMLCLCYLMFMLCYVMLCYVMLWGYLVIALAGPVRGRHEGPSKAGFS